MKHKKDAIKESYRLIQLFKHPEISIHDEIKFALICAKEKLNATNQGLEVYSLRQRSCNYLQYLSDNKFTSIYIFWWKTEILSKPIHAQNLINFHIEKNRDIDSLTNSEIKIIFDSEILN